MCANHKQAPLGAKDYNRGVERAAYAASATHGSAAFNKFFAPSREANAERYGAYIRAISIDCTDVRQP